MKTSDKGVNFITTHEGMVLRAYKDVVGVWTIGVGHTASAGSPRPRAGMTITRDEAIRILKRDLAKFEKRVDKTNTFGPQHAYDGAVSFDFNTGRIHNATWVKRYREGKMQAAADSLMLWVKGGGRVIKGLVNRRKAERALIFKGNYGDIRDDVYDMTPEGVTRDKPENTAPIKKDAVVEEVQQILKNRGFDPGVIDGWWGKNTKAALLAYQKTHPHLDNDGILGPATLSQLRRDAELVKTSGKELLTKGGGGGLLTGAGSFAAGFPWEIIVAVVVVGVVGYIAYKNWDLIEARFNKLFKREVA